MIDLQVKLIFAPALREPRGIYIPVSSADGWLRAMDHLGEGQPHLRLIPIADRQGGLMGGFFFGFTHTLPAEAAAYGQLFRSVHPRMWIPCNANTSPNLPVADWEQLLGAENVHIWFSPGRHLAYEPQQILPLSQLFSTRVDRDEAFDRSVPGVRYFDRLQSLTVTQPPPLDEFFQTARDDIGENADRLEELPPTDDERPPRRPMLPGRNRVLGRAIYTLTNLLPATASRRTWINDLEDWAKNLSQPQPPVDQQKRRAEIQRLLKMLADDPDQGLKFAIPMNQNGGRGQAPSGNVLTQRDTSFQWGRQRGGISSDPWEIEHEQRYQLMQQYRQAAQRELDLGRYRRAAYIFADLLQDFYSAAGALCRGQHFREAAQIYREKMNNRLEAANCLRKGGYLAEAAVELEGMNRWEEAGDLYAELEQTGKAEICYRQRITELKQSNQTVTAATLLFDKLKQPEEARELLLADWQEAPDMVPRIKELFRINQACCNAKANQDWLSEVDTETIRTRLRGGFFAFLVGLATGNPDAGLRATAQKLTPIFASHWIATEDGNTKQEILRQLGKYKPEDRLLARDCRFVLQQLAERQPRVASRPVKLSSSLKSANSVQQQSFPQSYSTDWVRFVAYRSVIYAAASHQQHIMLGRMCFGSRQSSQTLELQNLPAASLDDAFFDVHSGDTGEISPHFLLLGFGTQNPRAAIPKQIFEPWANDLPQNRTALRSPSPR